MTAQKKGRVKQERGTQYTKVSLQEICKSENFKEMKREKVLKWLNLQILKISCA